MKYPSILIKLKSLEDNVRYLVGLCDKKGIEVAGVTKVFCGDKRAAEAYLNAGIRIIGDSRLENLKAFKDLNAKKLLVRLPMISEAAEVVEYCQLSLNSEIKTIRALSSEAMKAGKCHSIILMVELGDLREGIPYEEVSEVVKEVLSLPNIVLEGIGTNLTCYGGVLPDENNLGRLLELKDKLEEQFKIRINTVSGGNSSSLHLIIKDEIPKGINSLRLGEAIVLGRETAYGEDINGLHRNIFTLRTEIIEIKEKPSMPQGTMGVDAFGNKPSFQDKGMMKRAIVALGRQDVNPDNIFPVDKGIEILGASSDHMILDITKGEGCYEVGSVVDFSLSYGGLLAAMNSLYISKEYI